jgi:uncharacterized protein (DUF697 family)
MLAKAYSTSPFFEKRRLILDSIFPIGPYIMRINNVDHHYFREKEMAEEGHLLHTAMKLAEALNRVADDNLPNRLAGIVKLHSGIAVGTAFVPIPGADIAAAAANIWTMYVRINKELDLPFRENVVKSIAAGAATNLAGGAAGVVLGSALKFIPGLGTLGGAALMGATVYGITIASGIIYMNALTRLAKRKDAGSISGEDLKSAMDEELKDKQKMKDMVRSAKKDYQPQS